MFRKYEPILFAVMLGLILPLLILFLPVRKKPDALAVGNFQGQDNGEMTNKIILEEITTGPVLAVVNVGELALEEYIKGVTLAEMPSSFQVDALRAQAVVARTYTCKRMLSAGKHSEGAVCTDSTCCQAYISDKEFLEDGGTSEELEKVWHAVRDTAGKVLVYENTLIEATYFSCSGGMTEEALAVWGTDIPYLQARESPGEEWAPVFTDSVVYTRDEVQNRLGTNWGTNPEEWIGEICYTSGGGIESIVLGGQTFTGTQLRSALSLRSTAFTMQVIGEDLCVTTKGFGHRVGMSQYGAQTMAENGSSWQEILAYYYPGTEIVDNYAD